MKWVSWRPVVGRTKERRPPRTEVRRTADGGRVRVKKERTKADSGEGSNRKFPLTEEKHGSPVSSRPTRKIHTFWWHFGNPKTSQGGGESSGACRASESDWFQISHRQVLDDIGAVSLRSRRTVSAPQILSLAEESINLKTQERYLQKVYLPHERVFEEILQQNQNKSETGSWHRRSS